MRRKAGALQIDPSSARCSMRRVRRTRRSRKSSSGSSRGSLVSANTPVAFKAMLRRRGIRVVSITEHADDTPTGKLMEAIIESVDEFYSENLAQEVTRGMREAASRGFWVSPHAPFGYRRVLVQDGAKKRPKLELDEAAAPIVRRIFDMALKGRGNDGDCQDAQQ